MMRWLLGLFGVTVQEGFSHVDMEAVAGYGRGCKLRYVGGDCWCEQCGRAWTVGAEDYAPCPERRMVAVPAPDAHKLLAFQD